MTSVIGRSLTGSNRRLISAVVVGAWAVAADFAVVRWAVYPLALEARWAVGLVTLAVYAALADGDVGSLGLVASPAQGWMYWVRTGLGIGLAVAALVLAAGGIWVASGLALPLVAIGPTEAGAAFWWMVVSAPLKEEAIYRVALCVPICAWIGPRAAVAASGLVFAALHVAYGNPSPENLVGGFFLAWAYLKSGTVLTPILLHALGNLCALAARIGYWYWLAHP